MPDLLTWEEWVNIATKLAAYWPDAPPLGDNVLVLWHARLRGYPGAAVDQALEAFVRDGARFRPNLPELLQRTEEVALGSETTFDQALAALRQSLRDYSRALPDAERQRPPLTFWPNEIIAAWAHYGAWDFFAQASDPLTAADLKFLRESYEELVAMSRRAGCARGELPRVQQFASIHQARHPMLPMDRPQPRREIEG